MSDNRLVNEVEVYDEPAEQESPVDVVNDWLDKIRESSKGEE